MLTWIISPRMILLPFAFGELLLAWSARFLPRRDRISALLKGIATLTLASTASAGVIAEVLLYRSLTGQDNLRGDNFFFAAMIAQGLVTIAVAFNSESALRRKEREARFSQ
jgi:hypothetical protein